MGVEIERWDEIRVEHEGMNCGSNRDDDEFMSKDAAESNSGSETQCGGNDSMRYPCFIVPLVVPLMREKEVRKQKRIGGVRDVRTERYSMEEKEVRLMRMRIGLCS